MLGDSGAGAFTRRSRTTGPQRPDLHRGGRPDEEIRAIVVPCHRVVAANGAVTGFSAPGGLATKRRLLELEGAPGHGQQVLLG